MERITIIDVALMLFGIDKYDIAEKKISRYKPSDSNSPEELFSKIHHLGCTEIVVSKNYCYIKIPVTNNGMVPPNIYAYLRKFNFEVKCGTGTGKSAPYYATACRHAIRKISSINRNISSSQKSKV